MCTEKSDERSHNSVKEPTPGPKRGFTLFLIHHGVRALRFLCKPSCDYSNDHTGAVNAVGHAPSYGGCHDKDDGICGQERKTVAELIGRREEALFFSIVCRFNSPGVDHNVLCR